ncbi:WG repeat-containing protein [Psychroserpens sp.]|uniref:WG repeat-containing protein n=1 Tax=Psychroserpens sp. TaxID=2020870 RepID=UPI00385DF024
MKIKTILLALVLVNCCFSFGQQFTKEESLKGRMKENVIFGDSLNIPVFSSDVWGFKDEGFHFIRKEGKWALKDVNKNKLIIPFEIDSILTQYNPPNIKSYSIKRKGKWESFTFTEKYKMKKANPYSGLATSDKRNNVYKGKDWLRFQVIYNGKRGVMNYKYEWIVPLRYDYALDLYTPLTENYRDSVSYILYNNDKVGLLTNDVMIEPKYDDIGAYEFRGYDYKAIIKLTDGKDYFGTTINGKMGMMNFNEEVLVENIYDEIVYCKPYSDNMKYPDKFVVRVGRKYGVVNITGDLLIPIEYESIEYDETFEKLDRFFVRKNMKYGIVNSENEILMPIEFSREELKNN